MSEVPQCVFSGGDDSSSALRLHCSPDRTEKELFASSLKGKENSEDPNPSEISLATSESDTSGIYFPYSNEGEESASAENNSISSEVDSFSQNLNEESVEIEQIMEHTYDNLRSVSLSGSSSSQRSPYLLRSNRSSSPIPSTSSSEDDYQNQVENESADVTRKRPRKTMVPLDFNKTFPKINVGPRKSKSLGASIGGAYKSFAYSLPTLQENEETANALPTEIREEFRYSEENVPSTDNSNIENPDEREVTNTVKFNEIQRTIYPAMKGINMDPYVLNINVHIPNDFGSKDIPLNVNIIKNTTPTAKDINLNMQAADEANSSCLSGSSMTSGLSIIDNDKTMTICGDKLVCDVVEENFRDENANEENQNFSCESSYAVDRDASTAPLKETVEAEAQNSEPGPNKEHIPENKKKGRKKPNKVENTADKTKKGVRKAKKVNDSSEKNCGSINYKQNASDKSTSKENKRTANNSKRSKPERVGQESQLKEEQNVGHDQSRQENQCDHKQDTSENPGENNYIKGKEHDGKKEQNTVQKKHSSTQTQTKKKKANAPLDHNCGSCSVCNGRFCGSSSSFDSSSSECSCGYCSSSSCSCSSCCSSSSSSCRSSCHCRD